ncbi:MAG TPA: hypothetical protein ENK33_00855 [Desulfobacterales bacterium]|nr:hypothetical protein [Desulfobacterales bacterium]
MAKSIFYEAVNNNIGIFALLLDAIIVPKIKNDGRRRAKAVRPEKQGGNTRLVLERGKSVRQKLPG